MEPRKILVYEPIVWSSAIESLNGSKPLSVMTMNDAQEAVDATQLNPDSFDNPSYWNIQPVFDVSDLLDDEPPKTASTLRLSVLREVFGLFDNKLSHSIDRTQLMALGGASQADRLWTEDKNTELLERMVLNRDGLVDESEFCKWFELALPRDQAVFAMVIAELKQVAVEVRSAAENTSSPMRVCEKRVQEPQHIAGALRPPSQAERKMEADMGAAVAALSAEMATAKSAVKLVLTPESFGNIDYWNVRPAFDVSDLLDDEPRSAAASTSGKRQATHSNRDIPAQTQLEIKEIEAAAMAARLTALQKVFGFFDFMQLGKVKATDLMVLGTAGQRLCQHDRLWTQAKNTKLISEMDTKGNGVIEGREFVMHFDRALPREQRLFDRLMQEFKQVCCDVARIARLTERDGEIMDAPEAEATPQAEVDAAADAAADTEEQVWADLLVSLIEDAMDAADWAEHSVHAVIKTVHGGCPWDDFAGWWGRKIKKSGQ